MKKTKIFLLLLLMLLCFSISNVKAETIDLNWQKNYGGDNYDYFKSIAKTNDGGYVAVGRIFSQSFTGITSNGLGDAIIVKYNSAGEIVWQKNYGGNSHDSFNSVVATSDGSYVAVGYIQSTNITGMPNAGFENAIIVKYNSAGEIVWKKVYGGNKNEQFFSIAITSDEGFIVAGFTSSTNIAGITNNGTNDFLLVKYNSAGELVWQKSYGGSEIDNLTSVITTSDGGFAAVGTSESTNLSEITNNGERDGIIVKYNSTGEVEWQKNYGGYENEEFSSIAITSDGGFIVTGFISSQNITGITNNGGMDACIVKYNSTGELVWQKNYGGNSYDSFTSIIVSSNGEIVVAGSSSSENITGITNLGGGDALVVKYFINHAITISSTLHGAIVSDKSSTNLNDTVTLTVTPTAGYKLKRIIGVTATKVNDTTYEFTMPESDVTITAEFELDVENPQTEDGILKYVLLMFISLIGIIGSALLLNKKCIK